MSKAFVSEDAQQDESPLVPERPSEPNPITRQGYEKLLAERAALEPVQVNRSALLDSVLSTVQVIDPELHEGRVSFGLRVTVADEDGGEHRYVLVGPDEVDAPNHRISVNSPIGRALIGLRAGDAAEVERAGRSEEWTVLEIEKDD